MNVSSWLTEYSIHKPVSHNYSLVSLSLIIFTFPNTIEASPSYSCSNVTNEVETIICNNDFLSDMDNQIATAYKNVMSNVTDDQEKQSVKENQIRWIKERNSCSSDYQSEDNTFACVKAIYRKWQNQLLEISKLEETAAHELYRKGNNAYREGDYYLSVKYFQEAFSLASDNVEKVRILGALAQQSKEEGNITLAKGYAEKILEIDETSKFAIDIRATPTQELRAVRYNQPENNSPNKCDNWGAKCLAMTWGADVVS